MCLPGLTRNARDFHELALVLSYIRKRRGAWSASTIAGAGCRPTIPIVTHYNIGTEAGDMIAGARVLEIDRAVFLGTSRGGLIIHILAAIAPQLLAGVIFNDIGPEIAPAGLTQISQYLNNPRCRKAGLKRRKSNGPCMGAAFPALTRCGLGALRPRDLPRDRWSYPPGLRSEPRENVARR